MHLIADSGSTKTTWVLLDRGIVKKTVNTPGLNPYFHTSGSIRAILRADLVTELVADDVRWIFFYGAGCSTENKNALLTEAMRDFFRYASIHIYHDILGAARALLGKEPGIACILGTGCNSCYYDGTVITTGVPSLGYIFGDEGAGSNIGKLFMEKYLKDKLPEELKEEFQKIYNLTLEDILNSLYNLPYPNRFLASFSEFIAPRQSHPFFRDLVRSSLMAFFEEQVKKYDNYREVPVSFVGSIAHHYREILMEVASENKVNVGKILQSPIEGLIVYHNSEY
jgi:glucosamine kinase